MTSLNQNWKSIMQLEEILKEIGFTEYKAKVYKTLLFLWIASSATVAKESGVPQTKAHGILNELAKEGFAIMIPGRPTRFKAIPPSSAIIPIIEERIQKENKLKEEIKKAEENSCCKRISKKRNSYLSRLEYNKKNLRRWQV